MCRSEEKPNKRYSSEILQSGESVHNRVGPVTYFSHYNAETDCELQAQFTSINLC